MKKLMLHSIFIVAAMSLLFACTSNQTADQCLNEDQQRKEIFASIANHQPYMNEMMQQMMSNDTCKQMMMESMMSDPAMMNMSMDNMMNMCKNDSSMCKMMMSKTMDMCDADQSKCNMMMGTMQAHSNVKEAMKGMCDMNNMK